MTGEQMLEDLHNASPTHFNPAEEFNIIASNKDEESSGDEQVRPPLRDDPDFPMAHKQAIKQGGQQLRQTRPEISLGANLKYTGEWLGLVPDGKGTMKYNGEDVYTGDFVKGVRHGSGEFKQKGGYTYSGAWKNDAKHGYGTEEMNDDSGVYAQLTYDGNFEHGIRSGNGYERLYNQ